MAIVTPALSPSRTVTALDMIKRAYRLIGVYSIGETPSSDETQDGLTALNAMLDSWANEKLMVYAPSLDSISLTPNQASYTIGPTGTVVSPRPQAIDESSYILYNGVSYPLGIITLAQYNAITLKTLTTYIPQVLWFYPDFPNAQITIYPVPIIDMTLKLWSWKRLAGFTSATDTLTLPPGYENAIVYNLAIELAPENEVQVPAVVASRATTTKKLLKRNNFEPVILGFDSSLLPSGSGRFNIYSGL